MCNLGRYVGPKIKDLVLSNSHEEEADLMSCFMTIIIMPVSERCGLGQAE